MPHLFAKALLILLLSLLTITSAGYWYFSSHLAGTSSCPEGKSYVTRVMGGWKLIPSSDPMGLCISNEELKQNLVNDPSWTDHILTFLSLKNEAKAAGNTYYISPGESLSAAVSKLQPGDTLLVRGGSYLGQELTSMRSGTSGLPITIKAYPGESPVFDGQNSIATLIDLRNASDIVINGIAMINYTDMAVVFQRSSRITLRNCLIDSSSAYPSGGVWIGTEGSGSPLTVYTSFDLPLDRQ